MKLQQWLVCLVLVIVLALGVRAAFLDRPFMGDELPGWVLPATTLASTGQLYYSAETGSCDKLEQIYDVPLSCAAGAEPLTGAFDNPAVKTLHPPLGYAIYAAFTTLSPAFGIEVAQRLAPFLFTVAIFALVFLIGKFLFNNKVALLACFIGAVSTYSIFHGAFRIDVDGAFVTLFVLAAFYSYSRWIKQEDKRCLYAVGVLLGIATLTRLSAAAFPVFFAALEVLRTRKPAAILPLLIVPGLIFVGWATTEIAGGNQAYVNAVLGYNVPAKESITIASLAADKATGLLSLARDLSVPLASLVLLAFAGLKWRPLRKQLFKPEVLLAVLVIFILLLTFVPYRGEKQRYFTVALPFIFLLVGWFLSQNLFRDYRLSEQSAQSKPKSRPAAGLTTMGRYLCAPRWTKLYQKPFFITLASFVVFAALFAFFKTSDHAVWVFEAGGSILPLVVLALPAVLLAVACKYKPQAVCALFGAYLAFSTVFVVMGFSNLLAYSNGVQAGLAEKGVLIAGRNEAVKEVFWYDWLENRKIDWNNEYLVLNTTQQMQEFGAAHPSCKSVENNGYPIVFVCPK